MTWVGVAVGGAALIGSVVSAQGSKSAAQTQAQASENSQAIQQQMFNQMYAGQTPYMQSGYGSLGSLDYLLGINPLTANQMAPGAGGITNINGQIGGATQVPAVLNQGGVGPNGGDAITGGLGGSGMPLSATGAQPTNGVQNGFGSLLQPYTPLTTPFTADQMQQYSPAYKFQMEQGQQGTLNGIASGQGALSGAAQQALVGFNQNYANTAFNNAFNQYQTQGMNAFNQYQTQLGNTYSRLMGLTGLGQGAASNQATGASTFAGGIGQSATNVGTALAGGQVGTANAISSGVGSLGALPFLMQTQPQSPVAAVSGETTD